ncbi:hypothetical protein SDJN03_16860, partial [Cucurbita argyrosperma subsp. sororia]
MSTLCIWASDILSSRVSFIVSLKFIPFAYTLNLTRSVKYEGSLQINLIRNHNPQSFRSSVAGCSILHHTDN